MNDFLLTLPACWVYAHCAIAKSMDGFDSLLDKRILPLCGIFYVRYLFALCFYGWVFWGAERLAGLIPGLSTRSIRPPVSRTGGGFIETVQRSINHDNKQSNPRIRISNGQ